MSARWWWGAFSALVLLNACSAGSNGFLADSSMEASADAPNPFSMDARVTEGGMSCTRDLDCDDRLACTVDHCRDNLCTHEPCTDCCPSGQSCRQGFGCGPAPRTCTSDAECADGIRCTIDRCRDGRVCENLPQNTLCESGQVCFAALGCIPRPPERCTRNEECTMTPCLGTWYCHEELGCQFRQRTNCDDGNECTTDTCDDSRGGCQHNPRDTDMDGHPAMACRGDDCDDMNAMRFPGATEQCGNGVDDNCNGTTDENCECREGEMRSCYAGPMGTLGVGICTSGTQSCVRNGMAVTWNACTGQTLPMMEQCSNGRDDNCNGMIDEGCVCREGETRSCYTGPMGTMSVGICAAGMQTCVAVGGVPAWGMCTGQTTPGTEMCGNSRDDDCDGMTDEGCVCRVGETRSCYTGPMGTMGVGVCTAGMQSCALVAGEPAWGMCTGQTVPSAEQCGNGRDDNCNGMADEGCCSGGMACTTTCGSTGMTSCNPMGMSVCMPPAETCNGRDDDCNGTPDNGFACVRGATSSCMTSCGSMGTQTCGNDCSMGTCTRPAEACNGRDDDCDGTVDNGFSCAAGTMGTCPTTCGSTGRRTCLGNCQWDTCVPPTEVCNGVDDNCNSTCDEGFTCCAGTTRACSALGFVSGTATCRSNCSGFDTSSCSRCGNNTIDSPEQCDGTALGGATCMSQGLGSGTLRCSSNCTYDTSGCSSCGNNVRNGTEQCDGMDFGGATCASIGMGFTGGTLQCSAGCTYNTSMCTMPASFNPSGNWNFSPGVSSFGCACIPGFGCLVNVNFGPLTFNDSGSLLTVTGGQIGCAMQGSSARTTRMVNVTCTVPGSCPETYSLVGTFTSDNMFTGTFQAQFTGSGCLDCTNRMWSVTGTR